MSPEISEGAHSPAGQKGLDYSRNNDSDKGYKCNEYLIVLYVTVVPWFSFMASFENKVFDATYRATKTDTSGGQTDQSE